MPITVTCSQCEKTLQVRDEYAGKQMQCPACAVVMTVPTGPVAPADFLPLAARRKLAAERPRAPADYKPCPKCGATGAERVNWTPWGSFFGPALFHHVRCPQCGYAYNGKTGKSNIIPVVVFIAVPLVLIILLGWYVYGLLDQRGWFDRD